MAENEAVEVEARYRALLDAWNRRDAAAMASVFALHGHMTGFDGSEASGRAAIEAHLTPIFRDHPTPAYVAIVREVRIVAPGVAILRAVTGLIPDGERDIRPVLNAIQAVLFVLREGTWELEHFQNTPAAYHGRDADRDALTAELRAVLGARYGRFGAFAPITSG
ncbi:MAG: SgcJ/EcaC family oxidoreductase [Dehalococcoidia bacterium]